MENVIAVKFIGLARALVTLFDKSGLRRLSSYVLILLTALPFALGSVIAGYYATHGLDAPVLWTPIVILFIELAAVTLFYFTRTTARIWALKHLLKDLGMKLDTALLKDVLQSSDPQTFLTPAATPHQALQQEIAEKKAALQDIEKQLQTYED